MWCHLTAVQTDSLHGSAKVKTAWGAREGILIQIILILIRIILIQTNTNTPARAENPISKEQNISIDTFKEHIPIVNKHTERCSAPLTIRATRVTTAMRCHFTAAGRAKRLTAPKAGRMCSNWNSHTPMMAVKNGTTTLEKGQAVSHKTFTYPMTQQFYSWVFPKRNESICAQKTCIRVFIGTLFIIAKP